MFCPNCNKELPDGTKFCGGCGTPLAATQTSTAPVKVEAPVTAEAPVAAAAPVSAPVKPVTKADPVKDTLNKATDIAKKIPAKYLKIGGIALAALLVVILVANLFSGTKDPNYAMYIKDEQVYFNTLKGKDAGQVTEDFADKDASNYQLASMANSFGNRAHMTADGKTLFYIDDSDVLFYRSLSNMKKEPVKLDSGVDAFHVSENGKLVTYVTDDGTLMQHNLKKEEKIAKDVEGLEGISKDGKIIYFYNEDEELICWNNGKEEELGDEIDIFFVSEDYKTIYYSNDDNDLFMKKVGKKETEIAKEVARYFGTAREEGTFFYTVYPEASAADYFEDADDYNIDDDSQMEYLCTLYFFNGSKSKEVAKNVYVMEYDYTPNATAVLYTQFGEVEEDSLSYEDYMEDIQKNDYDYAGTMIALLEDASGEATQYISINGKNAKNELEDVAELLLSYDGKAIYALCDVDEGEGTLFKASVSGGKAKAFKELDSDVSAENIYFAYSYVDGEIQAGDLYYYKDIKDGEGDLFVDGKEVDSDVRVQSLTYNAKKNQLLYYVDYSAEKNEGTLKAYNGKKSVEIASDVFNFRVHKNGTIAFGYDYKDGEYNLAVYSGKVKEVAEDVSSYRFTADGDVLYLTDYSSEKCKGDLGLYNGKAKIIDEDVIGLISLYDCHTDGCVGHGF